MESTLNKTSKTGVLNISPIKITGKYKIVITENLELYLDDYTGRRFKIDKNQQFLPQVANFLSTYSHITGEELTNYGAFNHGKQKAFHIPLYLEKDYPKYAIINRVGNKFTPINEPIDLFRTANVLKLVDLKQIGIHSIFDEIMNTFNQMLFYNLEDSYIDLYGFDVREIAKVYKRYLLFNNLSNQPYFDVLNNNIVNFYDKNEMFYPRFINLEFEFSDNTESFDVYNYFGYLGNSTVINNETELNTNKINVELYDYNKHIEYIQTGMFLEPKIYRNLLYTRTITATRYRNASVKYAVNNLSIGDYFEIYHPNGSLYYTYIVSENDMKTTLRESLNVVCKRATHQSNNQFNFKLETRSNVGVNYNTENYWITITIEIDQEISEQYTIKHSTVFKPVDEDRFISVGFNDVIVSDYVEADDVVLNEKIYRILGKYRLDGNYYLRLNDEPLFNGRNYMIGDFYMDKLSEIIEINPIEYYTYNDDLKAVEQFNKPDYITELTERFVDGNDGSTAEKIQQKEASIEAIKSFESKRNYIDVLPYVRDVLMEEHIVENTYKIEQVDTVLTNKEDNFNMVKNVMFESDGTTSFITPNILNIDKQFWGSNGNVEYKKTDYDDLKYHWFLIKSEAPKYTLNDVRRLRYFTEEPLLKSNIYLAGNYAETIFLGVKYLMNRKYKDYQFCVYLDSNNDSEIDVSYHIEIRNKTIYLVIDKYLDFVDLIRGGDSNIAPFLDLSFFYCVDEPHNSLSNNIMSFKTGGILLCDDKIPVMFEQINTNGWRHFHNGKWYVCLKRSSSVITDKFTELFPIEQDVEFYVYSTAEIDGEKYNYMSIKITMKNVYLLTDDYVWCEDVEMKFFDVKRLVLNTVNPETIFKVDFDDIVDIKSNPKLPSKPYNEYVGSIDLIINNGQVQTFRIINIEDTFSLKQYYFDVWQMNEYIHNENVRTNGVFTFPEYQTIPPTFDEINALFDIQWDESTPYEMFSIFDRNQLWLLIKTFMEVNVNFKHTTSSQTRKLMNQLLLNNLVTHTELESIIIKNSPTITDERLELTVVESDNNVAIWDIYNDIGSHKPTKRLSKINRIRSYYNPHLRTLNNELEFQNELQMNDKPLITSQDRINNPQFKPLQQVQGNVVSSLFVKMDDFKVLAEKNSSNTYNVMTLLMDYLPIETDGLDVKVTDVYQFKYDYIYELLDKFYYIERVYNNLDMSIKFQMDEEFILTTEKENDRILLGNNPKIVINFKRKE